MGRSLWKTEALSAVLRRALLYKGIELFIKKHWIKRPITVELQDCRSLYSLAMLPLIQRVKLKRKVRTSRILWLVEQGIDDQELARFNLPSRLQLQRGPPPTEVPDPLSDNLIKIPEMPNSVNCNGKWTNYRSRFPSQEVVIATLSAKQERTADSMTAAFHRKHHLGRPGRTMEDRFQSADVNSCFSPNVPLR